jgi:hypothetical protein
MGLYCLGIVFYVELWGNLVVYWILMFAWLGANSGVAYSITDLLFLFVGFPILACVVLVLICTAIFGNK